MKMAEDKAQELERGIVQRTSNKRNLTSHSLTGYEDSRGVAVQDQT